MADTTKKAAVEGTGAARTIGEELREKGAEAAQAAKDAARTQAGRIRDEAYAQGEHYRDQAADETDKVASALRRASRDLNAGSPQEKFVGQIADGVADAADRMRGMSLDEAARETAAFARRHPAAFLGGAALLGFAAARFLKATTDDTETLYLPQSDRRPDAEVRAPAPSTASEPFARG
jgi:hypothetical protein